MSLRHMPRQASRFVRRTLLGIAPPPPEELAPLLAVLETGDTFVDVGANLALFARAAAEKVGPAGTVLAIEPNPALMDGLKSAVAGLNQVRIAPVAVGDESGTATLYVFTQHSRSSLLKEGRASRYTLDVRNKPQAVTVPVEPLLSVFTMHGIAKVDAMKIDIEGYEDRALIPFFQAAPESLWPRRLLVERSPHVWRSDCIADLLSRGYSPIWEGRGDVLLVR